MRPIDGAKKNSFTEKVTSKLFFGAYVKEKSNAEPEKNQFSGDYRYL